MIRFAVAYLHRRAAERPPGYLEEVLSRATVADGFATFTDGAYAELVAKYRPPQAEAPRGWGPALWEELHRAAAAGAVTAAFLDAFAQRLPDGSCGCRSHWRALLQALPPPPGAGQFEWSWRAHNAVRARLGREALPLEEARALYRAV